MRVHTLIRLDSRAVTDNHDEIRAFMTVRDESLRLPQTLHYYRKLGVARFFITDNGSVDGTLEFLLDQSDCHVFLTRNSYAEARYGLEWQQALLDQYGVDHWCLVVDADEWFVYPGCENLSLAKFAAYLQQRDAQGVFAFLLDMYGDVAVAETVSQPQHSLLDACRYFDRDYLWDFGFRIPGLPRRRFPPYKVVGGPRWRLLFPKLHRHYHLLKAMWLVCDHLKLPLPVGLKRAPTLGKIPFVRWSLGTFYPHPHTTTPINLAAVTGVLLHFKFLEDFLDRLSVEVARKEHWDNASEYSRYLAKLECNTGLSFHYLRSVAYENSDQLLRLGLMRQDDGWMRVRENAGAKIPH
jgi:Glycosyl transferase family 2